MFATIATLMAIQQPQVAQPTNGLVFNLHEVAPFTEVRIADDLESVAVKPRTYQTRAGTFPVDTLTFDSNGVTFVIPENLAFKSDHFRVRPSGPTIFDTGDDVARYAIFGLSPKDERLAFFTGPGYGFVDKGDGLPNGTIRTTAQNDNEFAVFLAVASDKESVTVPAGSPIALLEGVASALSPDNPRSVRDCTRFLCQINGGEIDPNSDETKRFLALLDPAATDDLYSRTRILATRYHYGDQKADVPFFAALRDSAAENPAIWNDAESRLFLFMATTNQTLAPYEQMSKYVSSMDRQEQLLRIAASMEDPKLRLLVANAFSYGYAENLKPYVSQLLDSGVDYAPYADRLLDILPIWTRRPDLKPGGTHSREELLTIWREMFPTSAPGSAR